MSQLKAPQDSGISSIDDLKDPDPSEDPEETETDNRAEVVKEVGKEIGKEVSREIYRLRRELRHLRKKTKRQEIWNYIAIQELEEQAVRIHCLSRLGRVLTSDDLNGITESFRSKLDARYDGIIKKMTDDRRGDKGSKGKGEKSKKGERGEKGEKGKGSKSTK